MDLMPMVAQRVGATSVPAAYCLSAGLDDLGRRDRAPWAPGQREELTDVEETGHSPKDLWCISEVDIFADLSPVEMEAITAAAPIRTVPAGELLYSAMRAAVAAVVVALLGLVTAGCSTSTGEAGPVSQGASTTGQSSPFAYVGALPKTVDGVDFDPAPLAGKPVVLWFWAPWCTICRGEAPTVGKVAEEYAGTVQFVGVSGQDTVPAMTRFVRETGVGTFTHLADTSGAIWREYGVAVQPAFAFIGADGRADVRVGSLDEQTLRARVAELAAGAPTSTIRPSPGPTCSKAPDGTLLCGSAGPGQPATTSAPVPTSAP